MLPSLIKNSVAPTIRLAEAGDKPVRSRAAGRAKAVSRVQPEPAVTQDSVEQPATKIVPDEQYVRLDALLAVDSTRAFTPLAWLKNMHSAPSAGHVREAGRQVRRLVPSPLFLADQSIITAESALESGSDKRA